MITSYLQMIFALSFVIVLIVGAGYLMKRRQNKYGLMNILSYQSMGPRKGVAAIKIGKEILILGITPNDMRLLKTFREDEINITEREQISKFTNILEFMSRERK